MVVAVMIRTLGRTGRRMWCRWPTRLAAVIVLPAEVVAAVRDLADGAPVIVIDGPAGAGKTSTAAAIVALVAPRSAAVIHMDDLYDGWRGLNDELTDYLTEELEPQIRAGEDITHRCFDWHAGEFGASRRAPETDVLIVEGVGAGQPALADVADLSIWVEAPRQICEQRWRDRDGAAMSAHMADWWVAQDSHFARYRTRERADLTVHTAPGVR